MARQRTIDRSPQESRQGSLRLTKSETPELDRAPQRAVTRVPEIDTRPGSSVNDLQRGIGNAAVTSMLGHGHSAPHVPAGMVQRLASGGLSNTQASTLAARERGEHKEQPAVQRFLPIPIDLLIGGAGLLGTMIGVKGKELWDKRKKSKAEDKAKAEEKAKAKAEDPIKRVLLAEAALIEARKALTAGNEETESSGSETESGGETTATTMARGGRGTRGRTTGAAPGLTRARGRAESVRNRRDAMRQQRERRRTQQRRGRQQRRQRRMAMSAGSGVGAPGTTTPTAPQMTRMTGFHRWYAGRRHAPNAFQNSDAELKQFDEWFAKKQNASSGGLTDESVEGISSLFGGEN